MPGSICSVQTLQSHHAHHTGTMDRDLFALIGGNAPCLPLETLERNAHQPKGVNSDRCSQVRAAKWRLTQLENPVRQDGLKLKHWTRTDRLQASPFARFATNCDMYTYSTEEYYHWLRDDDWTKEETDYLFSLLQQYDLRFPVVHDRYSFIGSDRSIEDLKARYYSICQKLIHHRPSSRDESIRKNHILSYHFDKNRELERKKHVQALLHRTPSQILEEDFLYVETRRLEQNSARRARDRDDMMRVIGGVPYQVFNELKSWPESDSQPIRGADPSGAQKLPAGAQQAPQASSSSNAGLSKGTFQAYHSCEDISLDEHMSPDGMNQTATTNIDDQQNCIYRFTPSTSNHHPSVTLRSTRITQPKSGSAMTRIAAILAEFEVPGLMTGPKPLFMPTRGNVESYESLIQAANQLSQLKQQVDRIDAELRNLKKKKESSVPIRVHSEASLTGSDPKTAQPEPATINDTFGPGNSLAVSKPDVSRKINKRSASVSSADSAKGSEGHKKARKA